jgi:hypothetical protein
MFKKIIIGIVLLSINFSVYSQDTVSFLNNIYIKFQEDIMKTQEYEELSSYFTSDVAKDMKYALKQPMDVNFKNIDSHIAYKRLIGRLKQQFICSKEGFIDSKYIAGNNYNNPNRYILTYTNEANCEGVFYNNNTIKFIRDENQKWKMESIFDIYSGNIKLNDI